MLAACISPATAGSIFAFGLAERIGSVRGTALARRIETHAPMAAPVMASPTVTPVRGDVLAEIGLLAPLTPPPVREAPPKVAQPSPQKSQAPHIRPGIEALFKSPPTRPENGRPSPSRSITVFDWAGVALMVDKTARDGCRWPSGDPRRDEDFSYCGKPSVGGKSYCAEHCAKAYQPHRSSARLPPRVA